RLFGTQIEDGSSLRDPDSIVAFKDGCRGSKVAYGFNLFHSPTDSGLETDRDSHECTQLTGVAIPGKTDRAVKVTVDPLQPARFPTASSQGEKLSLQPF